MSVKKFFIMQVLNDFVNFGLTFCRHISFKLSFVTVLSLRTLHVSGALMSSTLYITHAFTPGSKTNQFLLCLANARQFYLSTGEVLGHVGLKSILCHSL